VQTATGTGLGQPRDDQQLILTNSPVGPLTPAAAKQPAASSATSPATSTCSSRTDRRYRLDKHRSITRARRGPVARNSLPWLLPCRENDDRVKKPGHRDRRRWSRRWRLGHGDGEGGHERSDARAAACVSRVALPRVAASRRFGWQSSRSVVWIPARQARRLEGRPDTGNGGARVFRGPTERLPRLPPNFSKRGTG
jgi:hypothetical protein